MKTIQIQDERIKELFRKTIHFCAALIPLFLPRYKTFVLWALGSAVILYSWTEYMRLHNRNIPIITAITNAAARKRDENKFVLGPVTLCLGVMIAIFILDTQSANMGIYALAFGDGIASLVGKLFGKHTIPFTKGKTVEGSLACFCAVFIAAMLLTKSFTNACIIAAGAAIIEVMPLKNYDNLIIPITIGMLFTALASTPLV